MRKTTCWRAKLKWWLLQSLKDEWSGRVVFTTAHLGAVNTRTREDAIAISKISVLMENDIFLKRKLNKKMKKFYISIQIIVEI